MSQSIALPQQTHTTRSLTSHRWSIILGNLLEHFDTSLYGFLAPLVGKAFFPSYSPLYQLILTYGVYAVTFGARPLGGFFFSQLTYRHGPLKTLCWSLVGVALPTGLMGFIPSAHQIGILAPCLLIFIRFGQSFCAAGENAIAAYYLIDKTSESRKVSWSGLYQSSIVLGIMLASSLSGFILSLPENDNLWRYAFFLGFFLGLWAMVFRYQAHKTAIDSTPSKAPLVYDKALPRLKKHWKLIFFLVPIYGFSYLTYAVPFVFLNPYLAQVTPLSLPYLMGQTSFLGWFDALLLPLMAISFQRFPQAKVLGGCVLLFAVSASFLLILLPSHSPFLVFSLRLLMVVGGVGFSVTLIPWTTRLYPPTHKYFLHSMGYNIGTEIFGRSTPALCLWLYAVTEHPSSPLIYILAISLTTLGFILWFEFSYLRKEQVVRAHSA